MDKVTRQCPQTTTFLKREENRSGIEPRSFRLPAYRLTARPNRLTRYSQPPGSYYQAFCCWFPHLSCLRFLNTEHKAFLFLSYRNAPCNPSKLRSTFVFPEANRPAMFSAPRCCLSSSLSVPVCRLLPVNYAVYSQ